MTMTTDEKLTEVLMKTEWQKIDKLRHYANADSVCVSYIKSTNKKNINIRIVIGLDVIEKLEWKKGDRVYFYTDPDYVLYFKLQKTNSKAGSLISFSKTNGIVTVTPKLPIVLKTSSSKPVIYLVKNNILVMAAGETQ